MRNERMESTPPTSPTQGSPAEVSPLAAEVSPLAAEISPSAAEVSPHADELAASIEVRSTAPPKGRRVWPLGLQGRLVISFMLLLMLGLEADGLLYASQTSQRLVALLGEQAKQLAWGLSLASQESMAANQSASLRQIGQDLLRTRNVLFVVFYDKQFRPVAFANRDPDYQASGINLKGARPSALMQVHGGSSPILGDYVEVLAPILSRPNASASPIATAGQRLIGYVAVGVSQTPEQAQLSRINILAGMIAAAVVFASLPLVFWIIHRIFLPIRQLVAATNKIASGSYDTQVAVDRSDVIGTLARSFNEMAKTVKRQQDDLAEANRQLDRDLERALADLKDKNAQLEQLAATDPLTSLYNRRHFGRVLDQLFSEAARYDDDLACVMIDLDGYKPINDAFGHAIGDQLLVVAGRVISANMRRMDIAARYGGDEFILLLPRTNCQDAARVTERIREEYALASAAVLMREKGVTMSVGIASLLSSHPGRADELVNMADTALYKAKEAGRNRCVILSLPDQLAARH
jgi:diguanylate cyclase (GGDEF)-like protein